MTSLKQDFARVDGGVSETPTEQLRSDGCLGFHLLSASTASNSLSV